MVRMAHCCCYRCDYCFSCDDQWRWLFLSFLLLISILSFLAYCYCVYFVSVDHDELRFGYALWSVRLNVTDIAQIEETNSGGLSGEVMSGA